MCGRTCVGVTGGKTARAHALRTHVLEVISHAHARVRPHIARVRVRTHLRNSYLALHIFGTFHSFLDSLGRNQVYGASCSARTAE